jgi:hypothetical protein
VQNPWVVYMDPSFLFYFLGFLHCFVLFLLFYIKKEEEEEEKSSGASKLTFLVWTKLGQSCALLCPGMLCFVHLVIALSILS